METGVVEVTVVSETGGSVTGAVVSEDAVTGSAGFITGTDAAVCAAVVCDGAAVTVSDADEVTETVVTAGAVVSAGAVVMLNILVVASATEIAVVPVVV